MANTVSSVKFRLALQVAKYLRDENNAKAVVDKFGVNIDDLRSHIVNGRIQWGRYNKRNYNAAQMVNDIAARFVGKQEMVSAEEFAAEFAAIMAGGDDENAE